MRKANPGSLFAVLMLLVSVCVISCDNIGNNSTTEVTAIPVTPEGYNMPDHTLGVEMEKVGDTIFYYWVDSMGDKQTGFRKARAGDSLVLYAPDPVAHIALAEEISEAKKGDTMYLHICNCNGDRQLNFQPVDDSDIPLIVD